MSLSMNLRSHPLSPPLHTNKKTQIKDRWARGRSVLFLVRKRDTNQGYDEWSYLGFAWYWKWNTKKKHNRLCRSIGYYLCCWYHKTSVWCSLSSIRRSMSQQSGEEWWYREGSNSRSSFWRKLWTDPIRSRTPLGKWWWRRTSRLPCYPFCFLQLCLPWYDKWKLQCNMSLLARTLLYIKTFFFLLAQKMMKDTYLRSLSAMASTCGLNLKLLSPKVQIRRPICFRRLTLRRGTLEHSGRRNVSSPNTKATTLIISLSRFLIT